jgi:hypothetical protein
MAIPSGMAMCARRALPGGAFASMGPNELLLFLSARKSGSWYQFRSCVDEIMAEEDPDAAGLPLHQRIRLNLSRLAHVEFDGSENSDDWRAAPPVLAVAKTPAGFSGILCGARSLDLLDRFQAASAALPVEKIALPDCPDALRVFSAGIANLERVARASGASIQLEAAASLLSVLDPIRHTRFGPAQEMPFGKDVIVDRFAVEGHRCWWQRVESGTPARADGLYRCTRWQQHEHYLRRGGKFMPVAGQTGKFIILNTIGRNVLRYNEQRLKLKIAAMCRPPPLIDRALHLCSGTPPSEAKGRQGTILTYENIPPGVASLAAELLGQKLA